MSYVNPDHAVAIEAEHQRLQELAAETGESIETVASVQVQLYRRSLATTREALADAVIAAQQAQRAALRAARI